MWIPCVQFGFCIVIKVIILKRERRYLLICPPNKMQSQLKCKSHRMNTTTIEHFTEGIS